MANKLIYMNLMDIIRESTLNNLKLLFISYKDAKSDKFQKKFSCLSSNKKWLNDSGYKKSKGIIVIDEDEDAIAGYAFVNNRKMIFSVYTFPEYRRRGIAKKLLKKCISDLGGNWMEVEKTNDIAIDFYKKMGFKIKGEGECFGDDNNSFSKKVPCWIMKIS